MKYITTTITKYLKESINEVIWYHGTPNKELNFDVYTKGNQMPFGVHFTLDEKIAHDFAIGSTKNRQVIKGNIFKCKININNIFDISHKHIYTKGDIYYDMLNEIGNLGGLKDFIRPVKDGVFYHSKKLGAPGYVNNIDAGEVLHNVTPKFITATLRKYGIDAIIKYKMVGATDSLGYNKVYTDALCVLDKSLVEVIDVEIIN